MSELNNNSTEVGKKNDELNVLSPEEFAMEVAPASLNTIAYWLEVAIWMDRMGYGIYRKPWRGEK